MELISDAQVRSLVPLQAVIAAVERAFVALDRGQCGLLESVRGTIESQGLSFGAKSGWDLSIPVAGVKVGAYASGNAERGLLAHSSTTLLIDPATGRARAVIEANYLNGMRTAAADALAVRHLARSDASVLGIFGIGGQAIHEAIAVCRERPIRRILAVGTAQHRREDFARDVEAAVQFTPEFVAAERAAREADVIVTVTPAREPVLQDAWVRPGTHISAMGADGIGKQELPVALVARSQLWVDWPEQASRLGEAQHAVRAGAVTVEQLQQRTLGGLLSGRLPAHRDPDAITIFDSSGIAIQDLAAAWAALQIVDRHSSSSV